MIGEISIVRLASLCPFRLGQRVTVSPLCRFADDWKGEYFITGLTWEYRRGDGWGVNIAIASAIEVQRGDGSTDGFSISDLRPVDYSR